MSKFVALNSFILCGCFNCLELVISLSTSRSTITKANVPGTSEDIQAIPTYSDSTALTLQTSNINAWEQLTIETAIGSVLDERFTPANEQAPLSQNALNTAFACPEVILPSSFIFHAPTGCESAGRTGMISNTTGAPLLSWQENCPSQTNFFSSVYNSAADQLIDVRTSDVISRFHTNFQLGSNAIDLVDCNGMAMYTLYESVYNLVGSNFEKCGIANWIIPCKGEVYIRYLIASKAGETVAMSPYLPMNAHQMHLIDRRNGGILVTMKKNKEWTPEDRCPTSYKKTWIVDFTDTPPGASGSDYARFVSQDLRWVTAAFLSINGLRDESRNSDGSVSYSACKLESSFMLLIFVICIVSLAILFFWLWAKLMWREKITRYLFKLQTQLLPQAPNQP